MKFKSVKFTLKNPTPYQRFVLFTYNAFLWIALQLYKDDEKQLMKEIKELSVAFINSI